MSHKKQQQEKKKKKKKKKKNRIGTVRYSSPSTSIVAQNTYLYGSLSDLLTRCAIVQSRQNLSLLLIRAFSAKQPSPSPSECLNMRIQS